MQRVVLVLLVTELETLDTVSHSRLAAATRSAGLGVEFLTPFFNPCSPPHKPRPKLHTRLPPQPTTRRAAQLHTDVTSKELKVDIVPCPAVCALLFR